MKEVEHHRWQHYLLLAMVITIFGLMIYQVVMQEQKVDRYYISVVLAPFGNDVTTAGLPTYPTGAAGNLNGGVQRVRDAVASVVAADSNNSMYVPHWSKWKLNVVPVVDPTTHTLNGVNYHYTFPIRSAVLDDTTTLLDTILANSQTITQLFANETTGDQTWATATFDAEVHGALTYGTYSAGAVAGSSE